MRGAKSGGKGSYTKSSKISKSVGSMHKGSSSVMKSIKGLISTPSNMTKLGSK